MPWRGIMGDHTQDCKVRFESTGMRISELPRAEGAGLCVAGGRRKRWFQRLPWGPCGREVVCGACVGQDSSAANQELNDGQQARQYRPALLTPGAGNLSGHSLRRKFRTLLSRTTKP